jgi:hypothetical protein
VAQAVGTASGEWQFADVFGTDHAVIALYPEPVVEAVGPDRMTIGVASTPRPRAYAMNAAAVPSIGPANPRNLTRIPRSRVGLAQFASEQLGREFGDRIARLATTQPSYGGHRLRVDSLRCALEFLVAHRDEWRLPDGVFLPASGNVQVSWQAHRIRVIAQFEPDGVVWFSVLHDGQLRLTGRVSAHEFAAQPPIQEAVER